MSSKMVVDRQAMGARVLAAIEAHAGEAEAGLATKVGGEAAGTGALQHALRRRLERRLAALVAADEAHLDAVARLAPARRRRDTASGDLYRGMIDVRQMAVGLYGAGADELLGLRGRVSQRPIALLRQARRVTARLADPARPRPEKRFATATVDEAEWTARLAPPADALERALDEVQIAARRAESTLEAKVAATADYDLDFGQLARYLEALFDLADLSFFTDRLRPTARRPAARIADTAGRAEPLDRLATPRPEDRQPSRAVSAPRLVAPAAAPAPRPPSPPPPADGRPSNTIPFRHSPQSSSAIAGLRPATPAPSRRRRATIGDPPNTGPTPVRAPPRQPATRRGGNDDATRQRAAHPLHRGLDRDRRPRRRRLAGADRGGRAGAVVPARRAGRARRRRQDPHVVAERVRRRARDP